MLLLGIDVGTTSLKAGLFDERGAALAIAAEEYRLSTPAPERVEFDAEDYWRACVRAVRRVLERSNAPLEEIRALGVSSQGETVIALDAHARPLRPALVWLDNRATREAASIANSFSVERVYEITGDPEIIATWTACKILWLKENEPEIFARADKFVLVADFIIHRLTGCFATDGSLACTSMLWDIQSADWWDEMLDYIGVTREQLAAPGRPGRVVGGLTREAARELGLLPDVLVVDGGMDQASGAVGAGNLHPGTISESTGGALAILAPVERPDLDPTRRLPVYVHSAPNLYLFAPVSPTGGMALKWFRDQFGGEELDRAQREGRDAYDLLVEQAMQVAPGCEGLTMLPHLMGAFSPEYNPDAQGVVFGLSLRHGKGHVVRAILEAIAFVLKRNLDLMRELGVPATEIRSTGGGAKSRGWLQIKADVTGLPVVTLEQEETAILGDAMLAGVAAGAFANLDEASASMVRLKGRIEPNSANSAAYSAAYARYIALYDHVADLFGRKF